MLLAAVIECDRVSYYHPSYGHQMLNSVVRCSKCSKPILANTTRDLEHLLAPATIEHCILEHAYGLLTSDYVRMSCSQDKYASWVESNDSGGYIYLRHHCSIVADGRT